MSYNYMNRYTMLVVKRRGNKFITSYTLGGGLMVERRISGILSE